MTRTSDVNTSFSNSAKSSISHAESFGGDAGKLLAARQLDEASHE